MQADTIRRPLLESGTVDAIDAGTVPIRSHVSETTPLLPSDDGDTAGVHVPNDNVPYKNIDGKRFWWLFVALLMAFVLALFDSTVMSTSHPVITSYFHASNAAPWLSTVFYLTVTVSQPLFGRISDTIGRRPVHLFSSVLFGLTTAWCGLAQNIGSFIAARAVCGLGAGGVMTMTNVILADVIKLEYRGIYQSYVNMAYSFGMGLGATFGGIICDHLGWRMIFGVQLPFIAAFIVLAYFTLPSGLGPNLAKAEGKSTFEAFNTFDFAGSASLVTTLSCLILGINLGGSVLPWTHPLVLAALAIFVVSAILFLYVETKATRPILPLPLLWSKPLGNIMWSNFLGLLCANFVLFNFPLLIQAVRQASPTASGLYILFSVVVTSIASFSVGYFIQRTRKVKPTMSIGSVLFLVGTISMAFLSQPRIPLWVVLVLSPWAPMGQAFLFPTSTVAALALCEPGEAAVVTTTQGLARNLGAIFGVAMSSWILQNALTYFLRLDVTGDDEMKKKIIESVRKSVGAIAGLKAPYKFQVITAYAKALQVTFASATLFAFIIICLILPLSLPRIKRSGEENAKPTNQANGTEQTADASR